MSYISISEPIVSIDWLKNNLNATNLVVLDGTINKEFDALTNQIPNTRLFEIKKKFSNLSDPFPSAFPSKAQFKAFGYNNVAVLNGGFPVWLKAEYTTELMKPYKGEVGNFIANHQPEYMKFFKDVEVASKQKTHTIVDARSKGRFNCETPEPREGLRAGTIPNSVNLPFTDLLDDGILKSKPELETIFKDILHSDNENIIFSCGSGITACVLALGAELCGYKNMSVYDGSWTEWGSLVIDKT